MSQFFEFLIMKQTILILGVLFFGISCNTVSDKQSDKERSDSKERVNVDHRRVAFQNNEFISYFDFSTGKTKTLAEGFDPCISPDGKWVAYTESTTSEEDHTRMIRLINTEDATIKDLGINDNNHYGAIWSPIGEYLAFSIMAKNWQIGLIKPDGSDFKILSIDSDDGLYSPVWSMDGEFVFAHSLSVLYKFSTSGELVEQYDLANLFKDKFYFSSSTRFWMTSDYEKLIFEGGIDEYIEGLNEPLSAIFSYDLTTQTITRISREGLCITDLWVDELDEIYFSGFEKMNDPRKIYQMSLSDTNLRVLVENGMRPSIAQ